METREKDQRCSFDGARLHKEQKKESFSPRACLGSDPGSALPFGLAPTFFQYVSLVKITCSFFLLILNFPSQILKSVLKSDFIARIPPSL
jgi:hypothetical protein